MSRYCLAASFALALAAIAGAAAHIEALQAIAASGIAAAETAQEVTGTPDQAVADAACDYYYFAEPGKPFCINLSTDRIGVRFQDGVTQERQADILTAETALDPETLWRVLDRQGTSVVGVRPGVQPSALLDTISRLGAAEDIYFASPVFHTDPGFHELLTDKFFVRLPLSTPLEEVEALNAAYDVELQRVVDARFAGELGLSLRVTKASGLNALAMANLYYSSLVTLGVSPDFGHLYPVLASKPNDQYYSTQGQRGQWYLAEDNVPAAWDICKGNPNIIIAVLDTGVDLDYTAIGGPDGHPDLNTNQWVKVIEIVNQQDDDIPPNGLVDDRCGWDFVNGDNLPVDDHAHAHGTSSAGVAAAVTNNSLGVAGIAGGWQPNTPGCRIMPVKATNSNDEYLTYDVWLANAIYYAADNGANVITMSLGEKASSALIANAVVYARGKGCVLIAAAHNDDSNTVYCPRVPARLKGVICVGAINCCETRQRKFGSYTGSQWSACNPFMSGPDIACWGSNYGPVLDIMAPGIYIWTTDLSGTGGDNTGDYRVIEMPDPQTSWPYVRTSSATPQVAGVAALILSATLGTDSKPTLTPAQVQAILEFSTDDMAYTRTDPLPFTETAGTGRDIYTGYGKLNAQKALELAKKPRFVLRNAAGAHLASFDPEGNFVLEGALTTEAASGALAGTADKEFIIQDANGSNIVRLDPDPAGDLFIAGKLYERVSVNLDTAVTVRAFRIQDATGVTMALINGAQFTNNDIDPAGPVGAGSLILKGRAFIGADPDRASSQGY